ncbi:MAG: response regulator transcription factor [Phycisphaerae bacterium]|jgi:RNA polymerase sigma factor (sigma-70 family)|nr:response regulator transcription factor [Phycisphaerae bacterium]MCZ2398456.1 response regulator transcription factor [Phycisphaerae bacterium]NUQ48627.1 response regulator transcription factor [Phycisphaerae bacterium]
MTEGTVFVVDDDPAVRKSLELLMRSVGLPVQTYRTAQEFLDRHRPEQPGCLVLDVRMPGMSGPELQRHLKETGADLPTIIITGHGDVPVAVRAMKDGALEFLQKPFSTQLLLEHIRAALDRDVERREALARRSSVAARLAALTERERQVMELVVSGKISKEVAAELGISKKTVDVHRARVMQKLQVQSLPELVELVLTQKAGRDSLHPGHRPS